MLQILEWIAAAIALAWVSVVSLGLVFGWGCLIGGAVRKRELPEFWCYLMAAAVPLSLFGLLSWCTLAKDLIFGRWTLPITVAASVAGAWWEHRHWQPTEQDLEERERAESLRHHLSHQQVPPPYCPECRRERGLL
jgi:hypothetical protein